MLEVSKIIQPSIYIGGVEVQEPVTVITNILIAGICFYAANRIKKSGRTEQTLVLFRWFYIILGIASLLGGFFGHAFMYAFPVQWKLPGWITSMLSIALIERSSILHANRYISPKLGNFFLGLNIIEFISMLVLTVVTLDFLWIELHSAYGMMVVVLFFHLYTYIKSKDVGSKYMVQACLFLLLAVAAFNIPIVIHDFFNHRDLAHMVMVGGLYWMMKGALHLGEIPEDGRVPAGA